MRPPAFVFPLLSCISVVVAIGSLLFVIRGYEIDGHELLIRRLLWRTRVDIRGLLRAYHDRDATRGSWRVFGNGGLFSFSGRFFNRELGHYRLFGTDLEQAVIMLFAGRKIVITPKDPHAFVGAVGVLR